MKGRSSTVIGAFALLLLLPSCSLSSDPDAAEIILHHTRARGGDKLEAIKGLELRLEIEEPGFKVTGQYLASSDGWVRVDIFDQGQRVFTEAIGPQGAWQMRADEVVQSVSQEGIAALERGRIDNLTGLHQRQAFGYRYARIEDASLGLALEETSPGGFKKTYAFDPETYLVAKTQERSALHPDLNATATIQETRWSEPTEMEGVTFLNRSEKIDLETGDFMQRVKITQRTVNPIIEKGDFDPPVQKGAEP